MSYGDFNFLMMVCDFGWNGEWKHGKEDIPTKMDAILTTGYMERHRRNSVI